MSVRLLDGTRSRLMQSCQSRNVLKPSNRASLISLPRFQYSLARLMIAITVVAIVLFLATKVGAFLGIILYSIVACVVPTVLVTCVIYGRRDFRAFAIGAFVPWVVALILRIPWSPDGFWGGFWEIVWLLVMGCVCGVVGVATRRWIDHDPS